MDMFEAVTFLRHRISSDGKLQVVHGAHLWIASFKWFPPATPEALAKAQQQMGGFFSMTMITDNGVLNFITWKSLLKNSKYGRRVFH